MTRNVVPAALVALALCAPVAGQAQTVMTETGPADLQAYPPGGAMMPVRAIAPDADDANYYGSTYAPPMAQPGPMMPSAPPPGSVYIQGHYNWDPARQSYVWMEGQYVQAPHQNAQWIPGHWSQTPTAWIWVDGRWN